MIRLKIKEFAQRQGLTQGKLARKADVDPKTISAIFQNPHHVINTTTLDKIALALNIDSSCLLENEPPLPRE